mmetsp:Transcript_100609/g.194309  ORF Transcript_100609/g.194309 Transcript_100609/m.194309 type:complete len:235 (+) Transcript_100609:77-781(+)
MSSSSEDEMPMVETGPDGLPAMSDDARDAGESKMIGFLAVLMLAPRVIGTGIAFLIFFFGATAQQKELVGRKLQLLESWDLGYLYFSVYTFSVLVMWVNNLPMVYKARLGLKGNIRANMYFYKLLGGNGMTKTSLVGLEEKGDIGVYNRANRSLSHFVENMGPAIINMLAAGFVFGLPTLVTTIVFCLGRVMHQIGYTKGYGSHAAGFGLALLATMVLEGLVLVAAVGAFGVFK